MDSSSTNTIDEAFHQLEHGIKLEDQGERSNSIDKLNAAAIHYFEACRLLKTYITYQNPSSAKRELLEEKISQYESRGRSLIRKVRRDISPPTLVLDANCVQLVSPPPVTPSSSTPITNNANSNGKEYGRSESLSMVPIAQAIPVFNEDIENHDTTDNNDRKHQTTKFQKVKEICVEADSIVTEAMDLDNEHMTSNANAAAVERYKDAAQLYLNAVRFTGELVLEIRGDKNEEVDNKGLQQLQKYHNYLKDRVGKILDRIEELKTRVYDDVDRVTIVN